MGELAVEDEERKPPEVVAVQVTDHHGVDPTRVDVLGLHRGEAGRAAVDQRGEAPGQ